MHGLRPYQRECVDRIVAAYRKGLRRVLVSLPTGTGKTVVFASFPRALRMKKKLLVLAHRDELLEQACEKFQIAAPDVLVAIEQGQRRADGNARVVVASVPTLGRTHSSRLAALDPEEFSLVVVDEAHHAVAPTYRRILDHFNLFDGGQRLLVGFTATPRRGDGKGLGEVFEDIVYSRGIEEMIREGWLCHIAGWRVATNVDLDRVTVRHGDFVESQLARTVNVVERNTAIVRAYNEFASGRRAIVFCADVAHAKAMAEAFDGAGISAKAVWGAMPRQDRRNSLDSLRSGTTAVLTNCNVLTEGFDEPRVDCIIMARPTKSRLLYAQMIGRGTRLHPEKENLVVIDVADNSRAHSLAGLHGLFDLAEGTNLEGRSALAIADAIREVAMRCPWIDLEQLRSARDVGLIVDALGGDEDAGRIVAERIRFFSFEPPAPIRDATRLAWRSAPGGDYALDLVGERLSASRSVLGGWELNLVGGGTKQQLDRSASLQELIAVADQWVWKHRKERMPLVDLGASWRDLPPTEKQLAQVRRMQAPVPRGLNRGQASWIISHWRGR